MSQNNWHRNTAPPIPENEKGRLNELFQHFDPENYSQWEPSLRRLVRLTGYLCEASIAFVNLIGSKTLYPVACYGYDATESSRSQSFCQYTIMQKELLEIPDAHEDEIFSTNPYVVNPPHFRAYAGMPLISPSGYQLGTLCVFYTQPYQLSSTQKESLQVLAEEVINHFELHLAHRKQVELNEEKDDIIRIVSHDMRNPLTSILGFTEMIKEELTDKSQLEMLEYVEDSGTLLLGIINVLLNTERIENDSLKLDREIADVSALTHEAISLQRATIQLHKQNLETDIEEALQAKIDPEKWKQIVSNLLGNACKFTPKEGRISLELKTDPESPTEFILTVADNGIGMSEEIQKRLFTGDSGIRRKGLRGETSSGRGLRTVKKFVDLHLGSIEADSTPNEGSRFVVRMPIQNST